MNRRSHCEREVTWLEPNVAEGIRTTPDWASDPGSARAAPRGKEPRRESDQPSANTPRNRDSAAANRTVNSGCSWSLQRRPCSVGLRLQHLPCSVGLRLQRRPCSVGLRLQCRPCSVELWLKYPRRGLECGRRGLAPRFIEPPEATVLSIQFGAGCSPTHPCITGQRTQGHHPCILSCGLKRNQPLDPSLFARPCHCHVGTGSHFLSLMMHNGEPRTHTSVTQAGNIQRRGYPGKM